MAYGLSLQNDAGDLTLSDQATTYGYIGKASLNFIQQPTTVFQNSVYNSTAGYQSYSIYWPADILPVLPLKSSNVTRLIGYTRSGDYWTITLQNSARALDSEKMFIEVATEVYVFGAPLSYTSESWGIAIYNNSGILTADMSRRPISFIRYGTGSSFNISDILKPGILGVSTSAWVKLPASVPTSGPAPGPGAPGWNSIQSYTIVGNFAALEPYPQTGFRSTTGYRSTATNESRGGGYGGNVVAIELNGL